jgi:hypothetical protein
MSIHIHPQAAGPPNDPRSAQETNNRPDLESQEATPTTTASPLHAIGISPASGLSQPIHTSGPSPPSHTSGPATESLNQFGSNLSTMLPFPQPAEPDTRRTPESIKPQDTAISPPVSSATFLLAPTPAAALATRSKPRATHTIPPSTKGKQVATPPPCQCQT